MSNPKELTLGELRLALARGSNEQTVREALEAIREDDAVAARHEQATRGLPSLCRGAQPTSPSRRGGSHGRG